MKSPFRVTKCASQNGAKIGGNSLKIDVFPLSTYKVLDLNKNNCSYLGRTVNYYDLISNECQTTRNMRFEFIIFSSVDLTPRKNIFD